MTITPRLYGRSGSHFTRVVRMAAHEAGLALEFTPVPALTDLAPEPYGGHPGLKLPTLVIDDIPVFGTENICDALLSDARCDPPIVVAADLRLPHRNAQELVWQAMQTQVLLVFGLQIAELSPDNIFFVKARRSLTGTLDWLELRVTELLWSLPPRRTSLWEISLFCLLEHITYRRTLAGVPPALQAFQAAFRERSSAVLTPYGAD